MTKNVRDQCFGELEVMQSGLILILLLIWLCTMYLAGTSCIIDTEISTAAKKFRTLITYLGNDIFYQLGTRTYLVGQVNMQLKFLK